MSLIVRFCPVQNVYDTSSHLMEKKLRKLPNYQAKISTSLPQLHSEVMYLAKNRKSMKQYKMRHHLTQS